jgi:hypothetical protein
MILHETITKLKNIIMQKDHEIDILKNNNIKLQTSNDIYKDFSTQSRDTVDSIAKKSKTNIINETNNIINMTPLDINIEKFGEKIDNLFTKNYLADGQKGAAKFAVDNLLKDDFGNLTYRCTDPSRHIYRYKTLEGDMVKDIKAKKLTSSLVNKLKSKSFVITSDETGENNDDNFSFYSDKFLQINGLNDDNKDFISELSFLTS